MTHKLNVLLVEDNSEDIQWTRETLLESQAVGRLDVIEDGEAALEYLKGLSDDFKPDLILLDLYLPKKTGLEILQEIKDNPALVSTPIIILTSSTANEEFIQRFNLPAKACLQKPIDLSEWSRLANALN